MQEKSSHAGNSMMDHLCRDTHSLPGIRGGDGSTSSLPTYTTRCVPGLPELKHDPTEAVTEPIGREWRREHPFENLLE